MAETGEGNRETEELNAIFTAACKAQEEGDFACAKAGYSSLLEKFPDAPILHYNLGLLFFEAEDFVNAVSSFSRAASFDSEDADILFNLALSRKKIGDTAGAICGFQQLLAKDLLIVDALYSLGGCYRQQGELDKAICCYKKLLEREENHLQAANTLAYLYHKTGEKELAISLYQRVLALEPTHQGASYMLSALRGEVGVLAPPADYVRDIFDEYAAYFEKNLLDELEYRAPQLLRDLCNAHLPHGFSADRLLDLGCGTGLSGAAFADMAQKLDGVDISEKMIALAERKGIYAELAVAELVDFLTSPAACREYQLFLACDVLNYFGRLEDVFAAIKKRGAAVSYLCFFTEEGDGKDLPEGFALQQTGRFIHSSGYIRALLCGCGFTLLAEEKALLRKERGSWVEGSLWLVRL